MSNALAIATVTTALAHIVRSAAQTTVLGADVVTARPDGAAPVEPRVRLFLYQVTPNPALRNLDLPTRSSAGTLVARPTVALDLHYLFSFYGNETELEPQRMLGAVARDLHTQPVLMRQMIVDAVASQPFLTGSNLADALEQVKLTPLSLTLDEISKIWSTFFQTPYALSVAYQATVVLIESDETGQVPLPVLTRGADDRGVDTHLGPFPVLESIHIGERDSDAERLRQPSYQAARLGAIVTLRGRNLGGDQVQVSFVHPYLPAPTVIDVVPGGTASQIRLAIPADAGAQSEWAPGLYTVTVIARRGDTTRSSNSLALALALQIGAIAPPSPITGAGTALALHITCSPEVLPRQRVSLLLADREVAAQPRSAGTGTLQFTVPNAPAVNQALVRVRADGVDSLPFIPPGPAPQLTFDDAQKVTIV